MSIHFRAVLGAVDQALTAMAHFLLGVTVARMGGVASLGQFAFAYAFVMMASMFHGAILGEVYSVDTSARAGERRNGAGFILLPTMAMAMVMVALSQFLRFWGKDGDIVASPSFMAALLASMCLWSAKVYFYCSAQPGRAIVCTVVYVSVMLVVTYASYRLLGSGVSPFLGMSIGAALAVFVLIPQVTGMEVTGGHMRTFATAAWRYAKWSVPAAGLIWFANNGYYLLMPVESDMEQTAGLRAVLSLMVPINTLLVGASAALLPLLAEILREGGRRNLAAVTHRMAGITLLITAGFALAMWFASDRILSLVYGVGFTQFAPALQLASVLPALWGAAVVYRTSIRAMGESHGLFKVYFFALFPVGVALMFLLGKEGAAHAVVGVAVTQLLVVAGFLYRFNAMTRSGHEVQVRQG